MSATTFDRVQQIVADIFQVPAKQITPASSPETVKDWDSVNHLNLVLALEQEFGIQIQPEEVEKMKDVGSICEVIEGSAK